MRRLAALVIVSLLIRAAAAANETSAAIVTGAELLYVRRGPGVGFPAFATIERGERIEVERLDGVWALVRLPSGQSGYVHSTFLSFPGETRATIIVPATATPTPTSGLEPAATGEAQNSPGASAPATTQPDSEGRTMRDDATAPAQSESRTAPDAPGDLVTLRGDVQRLTVAVDTLQRRIGEGPGLVDGTSDHSWHSAGVAVLVVIALLIGWIAGTVYGRQSERSRRSRIRF